MRSAEFLAGAASPRLLPPQRYREVAIAGRSNVGKSSLLNRLLGRHALARVSKTPGRTQQINFFLINGDWTLVDLPGYGFARVPREVQERWREVVEKYLEDRRTLRGVIVIVDVRRGVEDDDRLLIDFLRRRNVPVRLAVNKIDKIGWGERVRRLRALAAAHPDLDPIGCSASSGDGIGELAGAVAEWLARQPNREANGE